MYLCIQTLCWSSFGSNYSLESLCVYCDMHSTPGLGDIISSFFVNLLQLRLGGTSVNSHFRSLLPPPSFTIGMVLCRRWVMPRLCQKYYLELKPTGSILLSERVRNKIIWTKESFRCFLAISKQARLVKAAVIVVLLRTFPVSAEDLWSSLIRC